MKNWTEERRAERRAQNREWMKRDREQNPEKYRARDRVREAQSPQRREGVKAAKARYRDRNRETLRKRSKEYHQRSYERRKNDPTRRAYMTKYSRNWNLWKRYGITPGEYDAMLEAQGGVCAICKQPPTSLAYNNRSLRVDHDHDTGAVRGLLCHGCNCTVGYARENAAVLREAALYLERFKT